MTNAGYSGRPLAKKLGLGTGMRVAAIEAPGKLVRRELRDAARRR